MKTYNEYINESVNSALKSSKSLDEFNRNIYEELLTECVIENRFDIFKHLLDNNLAEIKQFHLFYSVDYFRLDFIKYLIEVKKLNPNKNLSIEYEWFMGQPSNLLQRTIWGSTKIDKNPMGDRMTMFKYLTSHGAKITNPIFFLRVGLNWLNNKTHPLDMFINEYKLLDNEKTCNTFFKELSSEFFNPSAQGCNLIKIFNSRWKNDIFNQKLKEFLDKNVKIKNEILNYITKFKKDSEEREIIKFILPKNIWGPYYILEDDFDLFED